MSVLQTSGKAPPDAPQISETASCAHCCRAINCRIHLSRLWCPCAPLSWLVRVFMPCCVSRLCRPLCAPHIIRTGIVRASSRSSRMTPASTCQHTAATTRIRHAPPGTAQPGQSSMPLSATSVKFFPLHQPSFCALCQGKNLTFFLFGN